MKGDEDKMDAEMRGKEEGEEEEVPETRIPDSGSRNPSPNPNTGYRSPNPEFQYFARKGGGRGGGGTRIRNSPLLRP